MPYCPRCGVEVEASARACPLCDTPIPPLEGVDLSAAPAYIEPYEDRLAKVFASAGTVKQRVFWALMLLLALPLFIVAAVDGFDDGQLSWSWITSLSLLAAAGYLATGFFLYKHFLTLVGGLVAITTGFLAGLDALQAGRDWFLPLGLPILLSLFVLSAGVWMTVRFAKQRGWNLFGFILSGLALFLLSLEALVQIFHHDKIAFSWSLITSLALIPTALYLFFLHYGAHKRPDLGRTFHL